MSVKSHPTTILSGQTTSSSVILDGNTLAGIYCPASMTGATLSFSVSRDNATFVTLRDSSGSAISVTLDASAAMYALNPSDFAGVGSVKVVSASAEGADRALVLITIKAGN